MDTYVIWRRHHNERTWNQTTHRLAARTDKEAQAKLRRKFARAGFSSMSLVAVIDGQQP